MKVGVEVDIRQVSRLADGFPRATKAQLAEFTEKVGSKIEREAKVSMRANVAGPDQARSRTGNLARQIRFVRGGELSGAVKAFANYSRFVHGAPYHENRVKKGGGRRKENHFFTTALANADLFIKSETAKIIPGIIKRI
jgi:hypothetical protein